MLNGTEISDCKEQASVLTFSGLGKKLDTAEDVEFIISQIKKNTQVTCINLSGNTLGIVAAEPLGTALEHTTKLKRCLFSDLFTGRLKTEIAPALRHLCAGIISSGAQLVELDLSDNAFGPNGVVGVVELLASPACFTLEILRMNNQGLGHEGCRYLAQALQKGREACGKRGLALKVFSAGRNRLENVGAQLLAEVLADMGSLEELSLYQNGIGIHGKDGLHSLSKILKSNKKLRLLNLSDNTLTAEGGKIIAKALKSLESLEELHLGDCILRSSGAQALAAVLDDPKVTPNLRVLNLPGNEITRQAGISLVLSLGTKSNLKVLDLNANEFGKSGIQAIIRSLESIDLLHTLPKAQRDEDDTTEEELVGDELYTAAFDEDQGSASESEEEGEEGEEEVEDSQEGFLGSEEEEYDYENEENGYEDEDEAHSSFITVKEQPTTKPSTGFSFRDLHASLNESNVCSPNKEQPSSHLGTGPFGGGLFSALPSKDSTNTNTTHPKAWPPMVPPTGLFGSALNQNVPFKPSHLFSPPILPQPKDTTSPSNTQTKTNLAEFEAQLQKCLTLKHNEAAIRDLAEIIKSTDENGRQLYGSKIPTHVKSVAPEQVVRLGLQLSLHLPHPLPSQSNSLSHVAAHLLASVLGPDNPAGHGDDAAVSRAINCLLVYLGALKAERDSEDYVALHKCGPDGMGSEYRRACYFYLTRYMFTINAPLSARVRNCLSCLLSEQKKQQQATPNPSSNGKQQTTAGPGEADRLRDELIGLLETQLADLRL